MPESSSSVLETSVNGENHNYIHFRGIEPTFNMSAGHIAKPDYSTGLAVVKSLVHDRQDMQ